MSRLCRASTRRATPDRPAAFPFGYMRPQAFADVIAPFNARNISLDKFAPVGARACRPLPFELLSAMDIAARRPLNRRRPFSPCRRVSSVKLCPSTLQLNDINTTVGVDCQGIRALQARRDVSRLRGARATPQAVRRSRYTGISWRRWRRCGSTWPCASRLTWPRRGPGAGSRRCAAHK